jgi:hypothetical protein
LLYNFGMAHVLLSHSFTTSRAQPLLENAHHILRLASDIIARRSSQMSNNHGQNDGPCVNHHHDDDSSTQLDDDTSLLQLGLVVLHGMIQVLVTCRMDDAAAVVFERYTSVRVVLERVQSLTAWLSSLLVTAPAA